MSETEIEDAGEYYNVKQDGNLRASISHKHDEILIYQDGFDEPAARFHLSTGKRKW